MRGPAIVVSILSLCALVSLEGCFPIVVTGAAASAYVASDRRNSEVVILDEGLSLRVSSRIRHTFPAAHVNVTSYNAVLLLTGEVPSREVWLSCEKIARSDPNVRNVINRLVVSRENSVLTERLKDSKITTQVKAELLRTRGVVPINLVRVVTERGVVYLMGIMTSSEATKVIEVVRAVPGVKKIINLFEYTQTTLTGKKRA